MRNASQQCLGFALILTFAVVAFTIPRPLKESIRYVAVYRCSFGLFDVTDGQACIATIATRTQQYLVRDSLSASSWIHITPLIHLFVSLSDAQIAQNMSKVHLCEKCPRIPADVKHKLNIYRTDCRRAIKGKEYWSEHIKSLGVYEDTVDNCLRVNRGGVIPVSKSSSPSKTTSRPNEDAKKGEARPESDETSTEKDARDDIARKRKRKYKYQQVQSDSVKREQTAINAVLGVGSNPNAKPRPKPHRPLPLQRSKSSGNDSENKTDDDDEYDLRAFKRSKVDVDKDPPTEEVDEDNDEEEEEGSAGSLDSGDVVL